MGMYAENRRKYLMDLGLTRHDLRVASGKVQLFVCQRRLAVASADAGAARTSAVASNAAAAPATRNVRRLLGPLIPGFSLAFWTGARRVDGTP